MTVRPNHLSSTSASSLSVKTAEKQRLSSSGAQRAKFVAQFFGQHRNRTIDQIDRRAALLGFGVDHRAGLNVVGHVGDMYAHLPHAVFDLADREGVVEVLGVRRVDGEGRYLAEVAPGGIIGFGDRRRNGLGRIFDLLLEMVGQAVFGQDGVHLGIVLSGAAQYLDQLSGGAFGTQRPVRDADHDFVAVLYVRVVPLGEIDVHRHAPGIHLDEDGVVAHVGRAHVLLAAALHDAGDLAFEGPGVGAAGDDELHAVAVQSIQRIALADIYVVFELLGADIHRSCRDHLYDALLTGTLLAAETVLFLPALLDSALGEQFRDDFTGTKTALLGGAARGRSQMLEGELVVREFPEQVNDQRRAVECGRLLRIFQFIHRLK